MQEYTNKIREIAKRLLEAGQVDMVLGFRKGTLPMMNEPCFVKQASDVEQLVWDSNCGINLANYLTDRKERIAIAAKGCDSRNIVTHIIENKIERSQLVIIGVPCQGMIDRHLITENVPGEVLEVTQQGDTIRVQGHGFDETHPKADVLQDNCRTCVHRNPVVFDEMVAEPVAEQTGVDRWASVQKIEQMAVEEKWDYFEKLLAPCIRCYACRNACPLCYCPTCFVDESRPQWVGKGQDPSDVRTFHFLRAYHCAGRCTDCGACERACPMGIKVRTFTKKLEKDTVELFEWEAGMTTDQRPPLDTYKPNDPQDFIK